MNISYCLLSQKKPPRKLDQKSILILQNFKELFKPSSLSFSTWSPNLKILSLWSVNPKKACRSTLTSREFTEFKKWKPYLGVTFHLHHCWAKILWMMSFLSLCLPCCSTFWDTLKKDSKCDTSLMAWPLDLLKCSRFFFFLFFTHFYQNSLCWDPHIFRGTEQWVEGRKSFQWAPCWGGSRSDCSHAARTLPHQW